MLRVTIEKVPFGQDISRTMIGQILIGNDGTGDKNIGNYDALVQEIDDPERKIKEVRLNYYKRSKGVFTLLRDILILMVS